VFWQPDLSTHSLTLSFDPQTICTRLLRAYLCGPSNNFVIYFTLKIDNDDDDDELIEIYADDDALFQRKRYKG